MEQKLLASRNQVRSLQDSLQTSEHVQKDFVKLSQSLQVCVTGCFIISSFSYLKTSTVISDGVYGSDYEFDIVFIMTSSSTTRFFSSFRDTAGA